MKKELVIVLDFGGQYNQLVARRVRECNVYCEIYSYKTDIEKIKAMNPKGIILTGGPNSCYEPDSPTYTDELFKLGIPVLGLCYGAQLMSHVLGGKVERADVREYGKTEVIIDKRESKVFEGVSEKTICWMSHFDYISKIAPGFEISAHTADCPVAAAENEAEKLYAIQFHPEVLHTAEGTKMINNFVKNVCECVGDWKMDAFVENTIKEIREKVGDGRVLLALSGGVDSSVAAGLLSRAIGKQLTCVFVDHGLLRKDEGDEVKADIVLLNTSKENTVKNMTIAVTADTESFTLLSQSDSVYIEKLAPQEEKTITFSYRINAKTAAGQYDLELAMDYADGEGNTYSTSGKAKITVQQSSEMQFDDLSFPSEVVVADVVEAKVQAMNLGRSKIYNVRAEIAADGLKPQGTIFIGDMEAGTAATGSTQVSVSSLSGSKLYGNTEGTVTYYYEDESGKEYTEEVTFTTTIKSPFSDQKEETTPDNTNQWWVIMAVVIGCIAVAAGVIIVRKIHLKKQDEEDTE